MHRVMNVACNLQQCVSVWLLVCLLVGLLQPDASDAVGQWQQQVNKALREANVPFDPREEEFGFKRFSRGCSDTGTSIVPFVAVPYKGLEFSSIRKACPLAFVQHTGVLQSAASLYICCSADASVCCSCCCSLCCCCCFSLLLLLLLP